MRHSALLAFCLIFMSPVFCNFYGDGPPVNGSGICGAIEIPLIPNEVVVVSGINNVDGELYYICTGNPYSFEYPASNTHWYKMSPQRYSTVTVNSCGFNNTFGVQLGVQKIDTGYGDKTSCREYGYQCLHHIEVTNCTDGGQTVSIFTNDLEYLIVIYGESPNDNGKFTFSVEEKHTIFQNITTGCENTVEIYNNMVTGNLQDAVWGMPICNLYPGIEKSKYVWFAVNTAFNNYNYFSTCNANTNVAVGIIVLTGQNCTTTDCFNEADDYSFSCSAGGAGSSLMSTAVQFTSTADFYYLAVYSLDKSVTEGEFTLTTDFPTYYVILFYH